jgi:hypothetical protein
MQLGFETIGNATLVAFDGRPVLVTDPWIAGTPYFGSWGLSHAIPLEQLAAIRNTEYVWFSHGHPDHLNGESLALLRDRRILLPAHVGGRIRRELESGGHEVQQLPTAEWVPLSDRIRVMCLPDYNQDAVLLVQIGDSLIIDANDAGALGWMPLIRRLTRSYRRSFLLRLTGFNDADMINFFDEEGNRIASPGLVRKRAGVQLGPEIARLAEAYGVTHFVPFSSMHRYQRDDSVWANECTTAVEAHAHGFDSRRCTMLPAFVRYDLDADRVAPLDPQPEPAVVRPPRDFGDDWGEDLDAEGLQIATRYFGTIEHLATFLDYVNLRVGGRDHVISLSRRNFRRGVTFEAPRCSLVTALRHEIFDDLLIGNFMKTTLHGKWPESRLYPKFSPYVGKYSDNGRARTTGELRAYFAEYRRRTGTFAFLRHRLAARASDMVRATFESDSRAYRLARRAYWSLRSQA